MAVTVYTKPNCPSCLFTKQTLDQLGISYQEVDLIESPTALAKIRDEWGFSQAPVVETEEDVWSGHRPDKLVELVED